MLWNLRRLLFIFLILNYFSPLFAQHDSCHYRKNAYITEVGGIGISPISIFEPNSTSWNNYVLPGYSFSGSAGIPILGSGKFTFGITALFGYYSNWYNINKYLNSQTTPGFFQNTYERWQNGAFTQYSFMAGAYAAMSVGKATIEIKATGGIAVLQLPDYSYYIIDSPPVNYSVLITQTFSSKIAPAFDGGVQVNYPLGKNISATFECEYLFYSSYYSYTTYQGNHLSATADSPAPAAMQMVNALLGITYSFGK